MNFSKDVKWPIYSMIILVFLLVGLIIIIKTPELEKKEIERLEYAKNWRNEFVKNNVYNISIITNSNLIDLQNRRNYFGEIDKLYINNTLSIPEEFIYLNELLIYHCSKWYIFHNPYSNKGGQFTGNDSIVYYFYPETKLETFNEKRELVAKDDNVLPKAKLIRKNLKALPNCDSN